MADYQRKPVADLEYKLIEDRARVVAELSPAIPEHLLVDVPGFSESVASTLAAHVEAAVEGLIINGDPAAPSPKDDFAGIMGTSGVLAQPFATDAITTIRRAMTQLQLQGVAGPFLAVIHPTDWEQIELVKTDQHYELSDPGTGGRSLPVDSARQQVWGAGVALSTRMVPDKAIIGRFQLDSIRLRPRERATLRWSDAIYRDATDTIVASGFETNTTVARAEMRVGVEIRKPWAFVVASLA